MLIFPFLPVLGIALVCKPISFHERTHLSKISIGQRFALIEEKIVLSHLFRHFSFQSTQTIEEIQIANEGILRTKVPIEMLVQKRTLRQ